MSDEYADVPEEIPDPATDNTDMPLYNVYAAAEPTEDDLDRCSCWCGCRALTYQDICPDCQHGDHAD